MRSIGLDLDRLLDRCRAYEPLLRDGEAFSHRTAAELYGLPMPFPAREANTTPLEVIVQRGRGRARSVGVLGHTAARDVPIRFHLGLPVVEPRVTWCQLAERLPSRDLIALGDAIVTGPRKGTFRAAGSQSIEELRMAVDWWGRRRGARALAAALPRVRVGAESRPESHLRVLLVDYGLPEPSPNEATAIADGVVHPDLRYERERIALEYQGDRHRTDRDRWQSDIRRKRALETAGWRVVEVSAHDLYIDPTSLVARVRALLAARTRPGRVEWSRFVGV